VKRGRLRPIEYNTGGKQPRFTPLAFSQQKIMNITYRLDLKYRRMARVFVVLFALWFGVNVACSDGDPAILAMASVPLFMLLLSVYLLFISKRHRLSVSNTHVESVGVWWTRRVALDEIVEARWQRFSSAGKLKLKTLTGGVSIDLGDYGNDDAKTLIRFFRFRMPQSIQQNWPTFWAYYWKLFDVSDVSDPVAAAAELRETRRDTDWLFFWCGLLIVMVLLTLWWFAGISLHFLWMLPLTAALWWWMRKMLPGRRGKIEAMFQPRRSNCLLNRAFVLIGLLIVFGLLLAFLLCALLDRIHDPSWLLGGCVVLGIYAVANVTLSAHRMKQRRREIAADPAQLAESEYMRPHDSEQPTNLSRL
jgi:hypothetical protein